LVERRGVRMGVSSVRDVDGRFTAHAGVEAVEVVGKAEGEKVEGTWRVISWSAFK
jgi:hypothetical protein